MKLKLYLCKNKISIVKFSEMIGYSGNYISFLINGRKKCPRRVALLIQQATNGELKEDEIIKDFQEAEEIFKAKKNL